MKYKNKNYGIILSKTVQKGISSNMEEKWLWILSIFVAIIGNGSVYEALIRGFNNLNDAKQFLTPLENTAPAVFGECLI